MNPTNAPEKPETKPAIPAVGDTVGYYWLKEDHVHHDNSFETASWWEDTTLKPGIYPVKVGQRSYGRDKPLFLYAEGMGTVTDAFFPSSFGGVIIGGSNKEQYVGKKKTVRIGMEIGWAISRTGNSPAEKGPDVWIDPKFWAGFAHYAQSRLDSTLAGFERRHTHGFDRTPRDRAGTDKHHAQWIAEDAELVETILWQIEYHGKTTPMQTACFEKNTAWVHQDYLLTLVEQPYQIQDNGKTWFIQTCITGGGAVGGTHLSIEEVARRLTEKLGPGELAEVDKKWYWKTPRHPN